MTELRVYFDGALTGAVNMQRDRDLLADHKPGDDPVLRLYRWQPAAVTIGYNQNPENFNRQALDAGGYGLEKRPTGGRAIFHADELTYSVTGTSPGPLFGDSLHESYMKINEALALFLKRLGLDVNISGGESREAMRSLVCFKAAGKHEIRVGGRKLVGSAQRRTRGVFLQHGSILTGKRHLMLPDFLLPGQKATGMTSEEMEMQTTDLGQELGTVLKEAELVSMEQSLAGCFAEIFNLNLKISK